MGAVVRGSLRSGYRGHAARSEDSQSLLHSSQPPSLRYRAVRRRCRTVRTTEDRCPSRARRSILHIAHRIHPSALSAYEQWTHSHWRPHTTVALDLQFHRAQVLGGPRTHLLLLHSRCPGLVPERRPVRGIRPGGPQRPAGHGVVRVRQTLSGSRTRRDQLNQVANEAPLSWRGC